MNDQLYWPVHWNDPDDGPEHIAFIDTEAVATMMVKMFEMLGRQAVKGTPVHLDTFHAFPESLA